MDWSPEHPQPPGLETSSSRQPPLSTPAPLPLHVLRVHPAVEAPPHPQPHVMVTAGLSRAGCSAQRLWFTDSGRMVFQEDRQNGVPAETVGGARAPSFSGCPVARVGPICLSWHLGSSERVWFTRWGRCPRGPGWRPVACGFLPSSLGRVHLLLRKVSTSIISVSELTY